MVHPPEVMGEVAEPVAVKNGWCGQIAVKPTAVVATRLPARIIELNFQVRLHEVSCAFWVLLSHP
jgi:hypothetical protein